MKSQTVRRRERGTERGSTLYMVAASLVVLLGLAGLAIDLAALYVGRSEAQRAADAAALAGAKTFVTSGYTVGSVTASDLCPTSATSPPSGTAGTAAASEGASNKVGGQTLAASQFTATCDFSHNVVDGISNDPLITVSVMASMPTFFMKIFGITSENVSATATAEAFNPTGTSACFSCIKPFFLPNCDYYPAHVTAANTNSLCPPQNGQAGGYWVYPPGSANEGQTPNPGDYPTGIRGEPWQLHTNSGPSKWFEIAFSEMPNSSGSNCSGTQSKPQFEESVYQCTTVAYACGDKLCALDGKANGPNGHSVGCLITYGQSCNSQNVTSVDSISTVPPFTMTAGAGNPFTSTGTITQSASLVTVPIYDGSPMSPGTSQGLAVTIVGWMQLFIKDIQHQGQNDNIDVIVLNATGCGTSGSGGGSNSCASGGGAVGGGGGFLPVRLVQNP